MQFMIVAIDPYFDIKLEFHLVRHVLDTFDQKSSLANLDINSWFEFYNSVVFVHRNYKVLTGRGSSKQHIFSISVNNDPIFAIFLDHHIIVKY